MATDEVTIDVGPVWCPSCKREFGGTERDAEVSALRAALEQIADSEVTHGAWTICTHCGELADTPHLVDCAAVIARDALGRYPKADQ